MIAIRTIISNQWRAQPPMGRTTRACPRPPEVGWQRDVGSTCPAARDAEGSGQLSNSNPRRCRGARAARVSKRGADAGVPGGPGAVGSHRRPPRGARGHGAPKTTPSYRARQIQRPSGARATRAATETSGYPAVVGADSAGVSSHGIWIETMRLARNRTQKCSGSAPATRARRGADLQHGLPGNPTMGVPKPRDRRCGLGRSFRAPSFAPHLGGDRTGRGQASPCGAEQQHDSPDLL